MCILYDQLVDLRGKHTSRLLYGHDTKGINAVWEQYNRGFEKLEEASALPELICYISGRVCFV
jgi:hypothetical protein